MADIARTESVRDMARAAQPRMTRDTRVVTFGPMQGVPWYLKQRVMVTGKLDELTFGSTQEGQSAWFPDQADFSRMWLSDTPVLVFLKKHEFEKFAPEMKARGRIVKESGRFLLVANN